MTIIVGRSGTGRGLRRLRTRAALFDRRHRWWRAGLWGVGCAVLAAGLQARHLAAESARLDLAAEAAALSAAASRDPALADLRAGDAVAAAGYDARTTVRVERGRTSAAGFEAAIDGPAVRVVLATPAPLPVPVPSAVAGLLPRLGAVAVARPMAVGLVEAGVSRVAPTELGLRLTAGLLGHRGSGAIPPAALDTPVVSEDFARALALAASAAGVAALPAADAVRVLANLVPPDREADRGALEVLARGLANSAVAVDPGRVVDAEAARRLPPVPVGDLLAALARSATSADPRSFRLDAPGDGVRSLAVTIALRGAPAAWPAALADDGGELVLPGLALGLVARLDVPDMPGGAEVTVPLEVLADGARVARLAASCGATPGLTVEVAPPSMLLRFVDAPATGRPAEVAPASLLSGPAGVARVAGRIALAPGHPERRAVAAGSTWRIRPSIGFEHLVDRLVTGAEVTVVAREGSGVTGGDLRAEATRTLRRAVPVLASAAAELVALAGASPGGIDLSLRDVDCGDVRLLAAD